MKTTPCKGCGKPIVFAKDSAGKVIPLDPVAPVYRVFLSEVDGHRCELVERKPMDRTTGMVSHFATCPAANDFSASKRKEKAT